MLRLRDIMTTDLLAFAPDVSVRDAMEALSTRHVSGAPVIAGTKVVGVVSATDLLAFAAELQDMPEAQTDTPSWDELKPDDDKEDEDEPPGAFFHDLWTEQEGEAFAQPRNADWNVLSDHVVEEAMNPAVCRLTPETPVERAADYMREAGIHRVLVMEGNRLIGLVSTTDIAAAVADHKLTSKEWVFGARTGFDARGWPGRTRGH